MCGLTRPARVLTLVEVGMRVGVRGCGVGVRRAYTHILQVRQGASDFTPCPKAETSWLRLEACTRFGCRLDVKHDGEWYSNH